MNRYVFFRWVAILLAMTLLPCSALGEGGAVRTQVVTVQYDGGTVGRCAVPADCRVQSTVSCCGNGQSLGYPVQLFIDAISADQRTRYSYCSTMGFIQVLDYSMNGTPIKVHQDGQWDYDTMTPMRTLTDAAGVADRLISDMFPNLQIAPIAQEPIPDDMQEQIRQHVQFMYDQMCSLTAYDNSIRVDDAYYDIAERTYRFQLNGEAYCATITTAVEAMQMTMSAPSGFGPVNFSYISWSVPFAYGVFAPEAEFDEASAAYGLFVLNTSASDSFVLNCQELSNQIRESVLSSRSLTGVESYCHNSVSGLSDSDDDYSEERFSDYLFDLNDYTLDGGAHVKVPTNYDYVYADDAGNVYATDSASDVPAGMQRLEKNH